MRRMQLNLFNTNFEVFAKKLYVKSQFVKTKTTKSSSHKVYIMNILSISMINNHSLIHLKTSSEIIYIINVLFTIANLVFILLSCTSFKNQFS